MYTPTFSMYKFLIIVFKKKIEIHIFSHFLMFTFLFGSISALSYYIWSKIEKNGPLSVEKVNFIQILVNFKNS
jgi:hypothetical protein